METNINKIIAELVDEQLIELTRVRDEIGDGTREFYAREATQAIGRLEGLGLAISRIVGGVSNED